MGVRCTICLCLLGLLSFNFAAGGTETRAGARFLYSANLYDNTLSTYLIDDRSGGLTALGSVAAGAGPRALAIHPGGDYLYVTHLHDNTVAVYAIDPATGGLTHQPPMSPPGDTRGRGDNAERPLSLCRQRL